MDLFEQSSSGSWACLRPIDLAILVLIRCFLELRRQRGEPGLDEAESELADSLWRTAVLAIRGPDLNRSAPSHAGGATPGTGSSGGLGLRCLLRQLAFTPEDARAADREIRRTCRLALDGLLQEDHPQAVQQTGGSRALTMALAGLASLQDPEQLHEMLNLELGFFTGYYQTSAHGAENEDQHPRPRLDPSSVFGAFVQHRVLLYRSASFSQVARVVRALKQELQELLAARTAAPGELEDDGQADEVFAAAIPHLEALVGRKTPREMGQLLRHHQMNQGGPMEGDWASFSQATLHKDYLVSFFWENQMMYSVTASGH